MREKVVGILGGMGPEATVDLMKRVIQMTPAKDDNDHIRMIVDNNPKVPSRIKALIDGTGESPVQYLTEMARNLERIGVDFLAMPCNTAHYYYDAISSAVEIPILNMITLTVERIIADQPNIKTAGLLASKAVLITDIYKKAFRERGVDLVYPDAEIQDGVMNAIVRIKAGQYGKDSVEQVQRAADHLHHKKAKALIIGCTELSVIADQIQFEIKMYDASQVLAERIVETAKNES